MQKRTALVLTLLLVTTLSGCSKTYITASPPSEYLEKTDYPTNRPATYGECITEAIPDWKAALDAANADKKSIKQYYEELK